MRQFFLLLFLLHAIFHMFVLLSVTIEHETHGEGDTSEEEKMWPERERETWWREWRGNIVKDEWMKQKRVHWSHLTVSKVVRCRTNCTEREREKSIKTSDIKWTDAWALRVNYFITHSDRCSRSIGGSRIGRWNDGMCHRLPRGRNTMNRMMKCNLCL